MNIRVWCHMVKRVLFNPRLKLKIKPEEIIFCANDYCWPRIATVNKQHFKTNQMSNVFNKPISFNSPQTTNLTCDIYCDNCVIWGLDSDPIIASWKPRERDTHVWGVPLEMSCWYIAQKAMPKTGIKWWPCCGEDWVLFSHVYMFFLANQKQPWQ